MGSMCSANMSTGVPESATAVRVSSRRPSNVRPLATTSEAFVMRSVSCSDGS